MFLFLSTVAAMAAAQLTPINNSTTSVQCTAPLERCKNTCSATRDVVVLCAATEVSGVCVDTIECRCKAVVERCSRKCNAGVESCSCAEGVDTIVCMSEGGLGTGGIVGVAVGSASVVCVLLGLGLFVLWKTTPQAPRAQPPRASTNKLEDSHYASTGASFRPDDIQHYQKLPSESDLKHSESHYAQTGAEFRPNDVAHYEILTSI